MFQRGNRPVKLGSYQIEESGSLGVWEFGLRRNDSGWLEEICPGVRRGRTTNSYNCVKKPQTPLVTGSQ